MEELPDDILNAVPGDVRPAVEQWWSSLTDADRQDVAGAWDKRREVCFFAPQPDAAGRLDDWAQVPRVVGGRFVPHDDSVRMHEWLADWQEYLLGHEEVILLPRVLVVFRTYRICRAEGAAGAAVAAGQLPAGFQCPVGSRSCPMRRVQVVAPDHPLPLTPAASGGWWVVAPWGGRGRGASRSATER